MGLVFCVKASRWREVRRPLTLAVSSILPGAGLMSTFGMEASARGYWFTPVNRPVMLGALLGLLLGPFLLWRSYKSPLATASAYFSRHAFAMAWAVSALVYILTAIYI